MNILPVIQLASAVKGYAAELLFGAKTPAPSGAKNTPASTDTKKAPAFMEAKSAPSVADTKNAPDFSKLNTTPSFAERNTIPAFSNAKNAPDSSKLTNAPSVPATRNAPAFADALRQAEENIRAADASQSNTIRQTLRDRLPSIGQEQRLNSSRQTQNILSDDGLRPQDASARLNLGAPAAAGAGNARRTLQQQLSSTENTRRTPQQQLGTPENRQNPRAPETRLELHDPLHDPEAQQRYTPLEKAPATPHSTNGVHYQLSEVGFTQLELAKLRDKLLGEGLSPQSLTVIEQLASHPHGATLGQLLALMNDKLLQKVSLSDSDKASLQHFTAKIDPGGALGKNVAQLLENGQPKEAWDALKSSLAALDPQVRIVFEQEDAALLCKTFGVSKQASLEVLKQFGDAEGVLLSPDIFTALMLPAEQEILDKTRQDDKLGQALAKHLQPLILEARQRSEKERQAATGADRRNKQSEMLIRDKFMAGFHKDLIAPEKDESVPNPLVGKKDVFGKPHETARKDEAGQNPPPIGRKRETQAQQAETQNMQGTAPDRQNAAPGRPEAQPGKTEAFAAGKPPVQESPAAAGDRSQALVTAKMPEESATPGKSAFGQDAPGRAATGAEPRVPQRSRDEQTWGDTGENNQDTRRDNPREALLARVEVRQPARAADMHAASSFTMPTQPQEQGPGQIARPAPLIRQALQQADQASLGRLANGGQRLELQLAPSELGAVTLILTSAKSGEISATIRSERSETAELVTRHLDMIRVSLVEQGIKVDKLEVQNQMLNNQDNWQGMEQHNAMREEQERREQLERWRRLGRQGADEDRRARDMQSNGHTAEISEHGLHLVA